MDFNLIHITSTKETLDLENINRTAPIYASTLGPIKRTKPLEFELVYAC